MARSTARWWSVGLTTDCDILMSRTKLLLDVWDDDLSEMLEQNEKFMN